MRIPVRAATADAGLNMTPMIDVVFLLIIFFLLSSHLARQETQLALPLPAAASGRDNPAAAGPRLAINVLADGTLLVAGRPITPAELAAHLQSRLAEHGDALEVRLRGDRSVPYQFVEPVLLACTQAGIWNVSFAVVARQEEG
jgi:biopolymer transport protein ExbD